MTSLHELPRWLWWAIAFPLIILNGWLLILVFDYFHDIITVFVVANILAFLLNYLVELFIFYGAEQQKSVLGVIFLTVFALAVLAVTIAPAIVQQLNDLVYRLPSWIESGTQQLIQLNEWADTQKIPLNLDGLIVELTTRLPGQLQSVSGQVLSIFLGTVGSVLEVVLTLVITFYLLLKGKQLWDGISVWLPQPMGDQIRALIRQNFHNYFVGQASIALIIGSSMTIGFVILQVPYGLLFGLTVGFMALFPFGLGFSIVIVSFLIALNSFWLGVKVLGLAVIIQQVVENGIAPRLLGGFTGVNPVWILIALLIGAKVGGVLGLLLAVPLAASIKGTAHLWRYGTVNPTTSVLISEESLS